VPADADLILLDRVFQPVADRAAGWATCFDLARAALVAVIALHTAVLAWDFVLLTDPALLALVAGGTVFGIREATRLWRQVAGAERRSRPGLMNVQRVTLRQFRVLWLAIVAAAAALGLYAGLRAVDLCNVALCAAWLAAAYFASCSPAPPPARASGWAMAALQGAR
jgi:hypothetical protein